MKTVMFRVSGEAAEGDLAQIAYTTPRGGMSYASYIVQGERTRAEIQNGEAVKIIEPVDSPAVIARKLADIINTGSDYCKGQFSAAINENLVVVSCSDSVDDVIFITQVYGSGKGKIEQL